MIQATSVNIIEPGKVCIARRGPAGKPSGVWEFRVGKLKTVRLRRISLSESFARNLKSMCLSESLLVPALANIDLA
jgi:hypothetical protein